MSRGGRRQALRPGTGLPGARIPPLDDLCAAASRQGRAAPSGATRAEAESLGRRSPGRHPRRPGGFAVHRRRPSQGLGAFAHPAQHPRVQGSRLPPDA